MPVRVTGSSFFGDPPLSGATAVDPKEKGATAVFSRGFNIPQTPVMAYQPSKHSDIYKNFLFPNITLWLIRHRFR